MPGICSVVQYRPFTGFWTCFCWVCTPREAWTSQEWSSECVPSSQTLLPPLLAPCADGKGWAQAVLHASSRSRPALQHTEANQTGKGMCFSLPTAGLLEKILPAPADFITSLPENPKCWVPEGRGRGEESREEATGWLVLAHLWHLCSFGSLPQSQWHPCQR